MTRDGMMAAPVIAIFFLLATAGAGIGISHRVWPQSALTPLGATVALAALLVLGVDLTAAWRFTPYVVMAVWAALFGTGAWRVGSRAALSMDFRPIGVLAIVGLVAAAPLLVLPVPLDTDAQGFGMLALAVRDGGRLDTLAPFRPDISYLYSPGASVLFATVSTAAGRVPMSTVMMAVSHGCFVLFVWLARELGAEIAVQSPAARQEGSRGGEMPSWQWATTVAAACSIGLWAALIDAHYTAILGLTFVLGWLVATFRYLRTGRAEDLAAAALTLAAVSIAHADSALILAAGTGGFALAGPRGFPVRRWMTSLLLPPLAAALIVLPWLIAIAPIIRTNIQSPYDVSLTHWRLLVLYHGVIWPDLAVAGAIAWGRSRPQWLIAMAAWLALAIDLSTFGVVRWLTAPATDFVLRFTYPFSIAWHAPVVPYIALGAGAIVWTIDRTDPQRLPSPGPKAMATVASAVLLVVALDRPLLAWSKAVLGFHGAFASANDVEAMTWIRDHSPRAARVLNYPGDYEHQRDWEAHWAPVITERDCVYFRMQPFFLDAARLGGAPSPPTGRGLTDALNEQRTLLDFWRNPADPSNAERLSNAGVDYVVVPEAVGDPSSLARAWRWRAPALLEGARSTPRDAPFLHLVHEAGGAQVYEVRASERRAPRSGSR